MSAQFKPGELARSLNAYIAIDDPSSKDGVERMFELGVDPNYLDEDETPAIFTAISSCNSWARKMLLAKKVNVNKVGQARIYPIQTAVDVGDEDAVRDLLEAGANPHCFSEMNLISSAIEEISEYAILNNCEINEDDPRKNGHNPKLLQELSDFFHIRRNYAYKLKEGTEDVYLLTPFSKKGPFHVYYTGKPEILGMLLNLKVSPSVPFAGTNRSAKNFLRNPKLYAQALASGCRSEQLEYLGAESDYVLNYKFKFYPKVGKGICEEEGIAPVELIVHYDLEPAFESVEAYIKDHQETEGYLDKVSASLDSRLQDQLGNLAAAENKRIHDLNSQLKQIEQENKKINESLALHLGTGYDSRIQKLKAKPVSERCYDQIQRHLNNLFLAWKILSTGAVLRTRDSKLDNFSSLFNLAELLPAPFSAPFKGLKALTDKVADKYEQERFKSIAHLLPSDELAMSVYIRQLSCVVAEAIVNYLQKLNADALERLSIDDMDKIAKFAFGITAYTIYNVKDLGIDAKSVSEKRVQLLTQKVLEKIGNEYLLTSLLEETVKKSNTPPNSPGVQTNVPPPIPPKTIQYQLQLQAAKRDNKKGIAGTVQAIGQGVQDKLRKAVISAHI